MIKSVQCLPTVKQEIIKRVIKNKKTKKKTPVNNIITRLVPNIYRGNTSSPRRIPYFTSRGPRKFMPNVKTLFSFVICAEERVDLTRFFFSFILFEYRVGVRRNENVVIKYNMLNTRMSIVQYNNVATAKRQEGE